MAKTTAMMLLMSNCDEGRLVKKDKFNNIKNKNSYIGRTYKVSDSELPHKNISANKIVNMAVIEENGHYVGGVRMTTKQGKNSNSFKTKHNLYKGYKTFLEIKFNDGTQISVKDKRMKENPWKFNLSKNNVEEIKNSLYLHSRQKSENNRKKQELINKK